MGWLSISKNKAELLLYRMQSTTQSHTTIMDFCIPMASICNRQPSRLAADAYQVWRTRLCSHMPNCLEQAFSKHSTDWWYGNFQTIVKKNCLIYRIAQQHLKLIYCASNVYEQLVMAIGCIMAPFKLSDYYYYDWQAVSVNFYWLHFIRQSQIAARCIDSMAKCVNVTF